MNQLNPKVYVACLESYNNGILYGKWINAAQSPKEIRKQVSKMLSKSTFPHAEEWIILDDEDFGNLIYEYSSFQDTSDFAFFIKEHDDLGIAVLEHFCGNLDEAKKALEEHYMGEYDSEADFVESFIEETDPVPERLAFYIDYEKMAYDFFINDFFSIKVDYKVHVFFRF